MRPTPVIPALTRMWRIGCVMGLLPFCCACYGLALSQVMIFNGWFIQTGDINQDLTNLADRFPTAVLLILAFFILCPIFVYKWLTPQFYKWFYSRGH